MRGLSSTARLIQEIPESLPSSPLPGGVAAVVRFFFHVPQWIQIGGALVGGGVAVALAFLVWRRRRAVVGWLRGRSTGVKVGLATGLALAAVAAGGFGKVSWDYMQHDNAFCTGCHVMSSAFTKFTESEHADLLCHDCHRQSIYASSRQLYLWVLERPEEIGPHAPVPNEICAECHIRDDPGETWERIAATAGHRVHLESDSAALAEVMCVTCHGEEVHRFVPADRTCGQADCHASEDTRIVLGAMSGQTGLHCVTCHDFTAAVSETVARDTAARALSPARRQCFSCHDMEALMVAFDPEVEPHGAACGACHDPHVQETPVAAFATCTDAGCHAEPAELTPFHRGLGPAVLEACGECHAAHEWTVAGENCAACHAEVARGGAGRGAPDRRAAPTSDLPPGHLLGVRRSGRVVRGGARGPGTEAAGSASLPTLRHVESAGGPPTAAATRPQQATFEHAAHRSLSCTECHVSRERHGDLRFRGTAACFDCHHDASVTATGCGACHGPATLAGTVGLTRSLDLSVWETPRQRELPFDHARHESVACADCHAGSRLTPDRPCVDCHAEHHGAVAACSACHTEKPREGAHTAAVHEAGCTGAGCHAAAVRDGERVAYVTRDRPRTFCLSCHQDQAEHEPGGRCADCHLLPDLDRPDLDRGAGP